MIHYLLDSSGLWRLLRDEQLRDAWLETTALRAIGSCAAQRASSDAQRATQRPLFIMDWLSCTTTLISSPWPASCLMSASGTCTTLRVSSAARSGSV